MGEPLGDNQRDSEIEATDVVARTRPLHLTALVRHMRRPLNAIVQATRRVTLTLVAERG
jgi:hypothetical protein